VIAVPLLAICPWAIRMWRCNEAEP
jgi:hypothetical protein